MRRLIALFLLVLLPLQSIWAAAEPYCQHEQAPGAFHVGHHLHEHHGHGDHGHGGASPDANKASSLADHDHHCCGGLSLVSAAMPALPSLPSAAVVGTPLLAYAHVDVTRIERPKWPSSP